MAYQRITIGEPITQPPCMNLRSKAIYVTGELLSPEHADEEGSHYCWCNVTQHILGPDDKHVNRCDCVEGRPCFEKLP